jgi:hypothetical protein
MQVTISINSTEVKFPGGTVGGSWRIELALATDPAAIVNEYEGAAPSSTFDLTEGDTYVIRGVRLDAAGAVLGPIATTQYTVGEDLVPIDVANTISAVASPGTRAAPQGQQSGRR